MMSFKAVDVMTRQVVSIPSRATVDDACAILLRHHISGAPVIDDAGRLIGIVTEYDLLSLLYSAQVEPKSVLEVLTVDVHTVDEDDLLSDVAELFLQRGLRRLPVVKDGRLTGIISRRDIVRFIRDLRERLRLELSIRKELRAELAEIEAN